MGTEENIQLVKDAFDALRSGDLQALLASTASDVEWIVPGEWALAGTHCGHAGLTALFKKAGDVVDISYPEPLEFIAQADRVVVVGFARGTVKATNKAFDDRFVFAITVRNGKVAKIREYIDTLALALASGTAENPRPGGA